MVSSLLSTVETMPTGSSGLQSTLTAVAAVASTTLSGLATAAASMADAARGTAEAEATAPDPLLAGSVLPKQTIVPDTDSALHDEL